MMPNDLPPWEMVYQQTQRWLRAGVFEALVHDVRALLRVAAGRSEQPSAAILDSRTLQSSPESGGRAGYDGTKRVILEMYDQMAALPKVSVPAPKGEGEYLVPDVSQYVTWLNPPPADPRVAHEGKQ